VEIENEMTMRLFLALMLTVFAQVAVAEPCDAPKNLADGWAIESNSQAAGFNQTKLCEVLKGFAESNFNFHSLIIERHGRLVAEVYKRGKDESIYTLFASSTDFDATTRHDVRSISKSVVSLLWGIAQAEGKTPPLNTPVLDLLPALADLKNEGREAITIAHLLTMSSGLDWNEPSTYNSKNDEFGLYWRTSQSRYVFNRSMAAPAGTRYNYNGGGTAVLAQILTERVGMSLPDYARKVLFEPLGITDWEWVNDIRGRPLAFAGLRLRPRDLTRIGRMVLGEEKRRGRWQGKQIVPADWLAESLRGQIDMQNERGWQYGYQWWVGKVEALGAKQDWSAGFGNGGQRLFMVPELDLVVVTTAGAYNKSEIGREAYQLFKRVVGAVRE
jgi:CubicO group peptidase (beta-lactamase class C family)